MNNKQAGMEYEQRVAAWLRAQGQLDVTITPGTGDSGVDIVYTDTLTRDRTAVQCKYYTGHVGVSAVRDVYAGARLYGCPRAIVVTNSTLTEQAYREARILGVEVWSRFLPLTQPIDPGYERYIASRRELLPEREIRIPSWAKVLGIVVLILLFLFIQELY